MAKLAVVLGASYGGARAAQLLAQSLPEDWTVLLVDRNSHANHLYVLPRLAVLPGHEHKAFIPYTNVFHPHTSPPPHASKRHIFLQAHVLALTATTITLSHAFPEHGLHEPTIAFDFAVYALGSHLPAPIDLWGREPEEEETAGAEVDGGKHKMEIKQKEGTKVEGVTWLKRFQRRVEEAQSVLVVGGGALGIQYATDIADLYPQKSVTLLHSRDRLLPRFDESMHFEIMKTLANLEVTPILGTRLDLASTLPQNIKFNEKGQRVVRTQDGREVAADLLLLCTGQKPNTGLLEAAFPGVLDEMTGLVRVRRTMQIDVPSLSPLSSPASLSSLSELSLDSESDSISDISSLFEESSAVASDEKHSEPILEDDDDEDDLATLHPHIFVIGDAADAFGAIKAGHTAYFQAEVAARNILRLVERRSPSSANSAEAGEKLEHYAPGPAAIKVSLGFGRSVFQTADAIGTRDGDPDDLGAPLMWGYFGMKDVDEEGMLA